MFKKLLKGIDAPEKHAIPWKIQLPIRLIVIYLVVQLMALLFVTTRAGDDLTDPSYGAFLAAGFITGIFMLWQVVVYTNNERWRLEEESAKKQKISFYDALDLHESKQTAFWIHWLAALGLAILIDSIALILGKPLSSLPIGLDRMDEAPVIAWLVAMLIYLVLQPLVETLIFQGVLFPSLALRLNDRRRAVVLTVIIFTFFYLIQTAGNEFGVAIVYWGLFYPLTMALTITVIRAYSQSTLAALGGRVMFGIFLILKALTVYYG